MPQGTPLQFGAKLQHKEAFVNSFNPFFDLEPPHALISNAYNSCRIFRALGILEGLGDEFEVVDDVDVLGALGLALATLDALAGGAVALCQQAVVKLAIALLIGELLQVIVEVEELGDGNLLRAALGTIVTGGAGSGNGVTNHLGGTDDDGLFLVVKRLEVFHIS